MNNFKIGDIVLFCWKPNYGFWRKGRIVANNFAMCNLPDFFGKPYYYVTQIDERDDVDDNERTYSIEKDYKYIVKFKPGMEWCIGKSSDEWPHVIIPKDIHEDFEQVDNADYVRWKNQFKNVTMKDYLEIPGLKEMHDEENKWKERIEKKLDDINDKLNKLLLCQKTWTDPYPTYPWTPGTPSNPWYDTNKPYCETETHETHNYTSNIPLEDMHLYQERYSNSTDVDFDYKKYNNMCCDTRMESTMFGNEILDSKTDNKSNKKNKK